MVGPEDEPNMSAAKISWEETWKRGAKSFWYWQFVGPLLTSSSPGQNKLAIIPILWSLITQERFLKVWVIGSHRRLWVPCEFWCELRAFYSVFRFFLSFVACQSSWYLEFKSFILFIPYCIPIEVLFDFYLIVKFVQNPCNFLMQFSYDNPIFIGISAPLL